MRFLWVSDSPTTPSGFGAVTRAVCQRLAARGHDVEILGWQDRWTTSTWKGIPVRPVRWNEFGADVLLTYALRFQPDFIVTLGDPWWLAFMADPPLQRHLDVSGARWALYYPVDGATPDGTLPPSWRRVLEAADIPIAMSRYGARISRASGIDSAYIPHGCDLDIFAPSADKAAAKARLGYDGAFVVLSDARNQPRKLLPRLLDVTAEFACGKPDVVLHIHADPDDDAARSDLYNYRIRADVRELGLDGIARFSRDFHMTSQGGLPVERLAEIYQAADTHLLTSWGEGFGLPNLQASATGVVPIAVAYAASEELVAGHGFALPAESSVTDEFGLRRCLLDRRAAIAALETLYRDRGELAARAAASRAFALDYGWDRIADRWEEVLRRAEPRRPSPPIATFQWGMRRPVAESPLPEPIVAATENAFATLPGGVTVTVSLSERRHGEVGAQILSDAFVSGDELSIPVRLPPLFDEAPRAAVGALYVAAGSRQLARRAAAIFPGLRWIRAPEDVHAAVSGELLALLARCCLALDVDGTGPVDLGIACAALGVPFLGPSELWPPPPDADELQALRRLLTDQGYSQARRRTASELVAANLGEHAVRTYRKRAAARRGAELAGSGAA
jgi:glycosyltransferase involved in cell wall biosynthesis